MVIINNKAIYKTSDAQCNYSPTSGGIFHFWMRPTTFQLPGLLTACHASSSAHTPPDPSVEDAEVPLCSCSHGPPILQGSVGIGSCRALQWKVFTSHFATAVF